MALVRLACNNRISRHFMPLFQYPTTGLAARLDYVFSARGVVARARGVDDGAALLSPPVPTNSSVGSYVGPNSHLGLWENHRLRENFKGPFSSPILKDWNQEFRKFT